jgi:phenylacetic acid degradation operon negative regulatory protein
VTESARNLPAVAALTARSVVLSTLLGYQPPELPARALVRVGGLFGMGEKTIRMALTRMVADGDLVREDGRYRLTARLVDRQARQEESSAPRYRAWRGAWEMAVVTAASRPLADRVALRKDMVQLRLGELREGVWMRPANLARKPSEDVLDQCALFESRPLDDPGELAWKLWDLNGWADEAVRLGAELDSAVGLVEGFMTIAGVVRHLALDPMLPAALLPGGWPGDDLRDRYNRFRADYASRLREFSTS